MDPREGELIVLKWRDLQRLKDFSPVYLHLKRQSPPSVRVQRSRAGEQLFREHVIHGTREMPMKALIATIVFAAMSGPVIAQNAGPAPQSGMERPENTNGATERGAMDTTGMNADQAKRPETKGASKDRRKDDKK